MDLGTAQLQAGLAKLQKLPRPWRIAVHPLIALVVIGLYGYLFLLPARESLAAARAKQFELQRKLNEVRSVAANMEAFEEEVAALEKELRFALRQLPDSKELPVLLTDVTSLGKNAGLEFKAFRPQPEIRREFYAEVPIEIEFTGGFHEIASFLDRVARLPRIVNVAELEMEIASESAEATELKVSGRATTFRFIEAPPEAPKASPGPRGRARPAKAQGGAS
jgi:type IV pilus assembly protein PilO